jgi:glycosyltransferase involved in cell wall biosynthesis
VCSNATSLPEVVGDAGILVDPTDSAALSAAILRVLTSVETAQELRDRGIARAGQLTWERVARQTVAVYEETFKRSSRKNH